MKIPKREDVVRYHEFLKSAVDLFKEYLEKKNNILDKTNELIKNIEKFDGNFWGYHDPLTFGLHIMRSGYDNEKVHSIIIKHFQAAYDTIKQKYAEADAYNPKIAVDKLLAELSKT